MENSNESLEAVEKKFETYKDLDPFPQIPPALLNSADIADYIKETGMVHPFDPTQLAGATLGLKIGGLIIYWAKGKRIKEDIGIKKKFILKSNSIAYVSIAEELRLPNYLIARFNLRVGNAYKGILLGTGPIVDPGFEGRLSIPLHN